MGLDTGNGDNYEDVQYTYRPQLKKDRDRELIAMLPDFLRDEIEFARPQVSKFYTRVSKSLTERLEERAVDGVFSEVLDTLVYDGTESGNE